MKAVLDESSLEYFLEEYLRLEEELKPKLKRMEELKKWCKDMGTFSTQNFTCSIEDRERTGLVGLAKAQEIVGQDFLEQNGLIQTTFFQIVHIAKKYL